MRTIHRDIVGGFIFSSDGKLLLGKSTTGVFEGCWVVPGGGIEHNETRLDALRREILEETGIDLTIGHIDDITTGQHGESEKRLRDTGEQVHVIMTFFDYKITLPLPASKVPIVSADDFAEAQWFTLDEVKELPLSPSTDFTLHSIGYIK